MKYWFFGEGKQDANSHGITKSYIKHEKSIIKKLLVSSHDQIKDDNSIKETIENERKTRNVLEGVRIEPFDVYSFKEEKLLVIWALQHEKQIIRYNGYLLSVNPVSVYVRNDIETPPSLEAELEHDQELVKYFKAAFDNRSTLQHEKLIGEYKKYNKDWPPKPTVSPPPMPIAPPQIPPNSGTTVINAHVDRKIHAGLKSISATTGNNMDYLLHEAIALLFEKHGVVMPTELQRKLTDLAPKRRGPLPGQGGRPKKISLGD